MTKRTLVAVVRKDGKNEGRYPLLCYAENVFLLEHEQVVPASSETTPLEALANFLDEVAAAERSPSFGMHRLLAVLFYQALGRAQVTTLMKKIAEYGGLDGMRQEDEAFAELGIQNLWDDWSLPDTDSSSSC